jgi:transposase
MSHRQSKKTRPPAELIELIAVSVPELNAIVELGQTRPLTAEEAQKLKATFSTLDHLKKIWQSQSGAIRRLLKTLFGPRTEKTEAVLGKTSAAEPTDVESIRKEAQSLPSPASGGENRADRGTSELSTTLPIPRKGHGRNAVTALTGAKRVPVPHQMLARGEACMDPLCDGKVYPLEEPKKLVRIQGVAPLMATVYECDRLRCNLCLEVYTAPAPQGIGEQKYDETATATIGLLRYDCGLPHNQIERIQEGYGVPCPTSTQWDLVEEAGEDLKPGFHELLRQGAQKNLQHTDDTKMRVLGLTRHRAALANPDVRRLGHQSAEGLRNVAGELYESRATPTRGCGGGLPRRSALRAGVAARGLPGRP